MLALLFLMLGAWAQTSGPLTPDDMMHPDWDAMREGANGLCQDVRTTADLAQAGAVRLQTAQQMAEVLTVNADGVLASVLERIRTDLEETDQPEEGRRIRDTIERAQTEFRTQAATYTAESVELALRVDFNARVKRLHGRKLQGARTACSEHLVQTVRYVTTVHQLAVPARDDINAELRIFYLLVLPGYDPPFLLDPTSNEAAAPAPE